LGRYSDKLITILLPPHARGRLSAKPGRIGGAQQPKAATCMSDVSHTDRMVKLHVYGKLLFLDRLSNVANFLLQLLVGLRPSGFRGRKAEILLHSSSKSPTNRVATAATLRLQLLVPVLLHWRREGGPRWLAAGSKRAPCCSLDAVQLPRPEAARRWFSGTSRAVVVVLPSD
jgi:hypothetical protein